MKAFINNLVQNFDRKHAVVTATLVMLMLHSSRYYFIQVPISVVSIIPLLFPQYKLARPVWIGLLLLLVLLHIPYLYEMDNYTYIHIYLCLAILVCTYADDFESSMAYNARVMLIIIFGFATLNKSLSTEYTNGDFFHFSALTDNRFTKFLSSIKILPHPVMQHNWASFMYMINDAPMPYQNTLQSTPAVATVASLLTWGAIILEGSIALLFLLPEKYKLSQYRDYLLFTFIIVTYSFANVTGFGCAIAILGIAQSKSKKKALVFALLFLLLQLYSMGIYKVFNKLGM